LFFFSFARKIAKERNHSEFGSGIKALVCGLKERSNNIVDGLFFFQKKNQKAWPWGGFNSRVKALGIGLWF
jgi:hypothetical protein